MNDSPPVDVAGEREVSGLLASFVRHPTAANLLMMLMLLFGLVGLLRINTQFFPTIETKFVVVTIPWAGASAEDVESNVLAVAEPSLRFLAGVKEVSSYARQGSGTVRLEFEEGTDMQQAVSDVETAVAALANLPEDAEKPVVTYARFFETVARVSLSGPFSEPALKAFARKMRDDLIARGVDQVTLTGARKEEWHVEVNDTELRRLDLTVSDVATRIGQNLRDTPAGDLTGDVEQQIRTSAPARTPDDVARTEVKTVPTGERVEVRDIATLATRLSEDEARGLQQGRPAIELDVQRAVTADTLKVAGILNAYLEEIAPQLPPSLELKKYSVGADLIEGRIWLLVANGLSGLIIVVLVLLLFLDARIAFWVAMGIPVAIGTTLGVMWVSGQTIDMMSLFALIMTLGIIVDDAIVVGEHTATRIAAGDPSELAAMRGAGSMLWPVIASSTTTIASFAPILLVGDIIGQIMAAIPLVVVSVLAASLIECFFVLPAHLSHAMRPKPPARWSTWRHMALATVLGLALMWLVNGSTAGTGVLANLKLLAAQVGPWPFAALVAASAFLLAAPLEWLLTRRARAMARGGAPARASLRDGFDRLFNRFRDGPFSAFVTLAYRWRLTTVAVAIASLVLSMGLLMGGRVGFEFFPTPEAENLQATVEFNAGIPEERAVAMLNRIEAGIYAAETAVGAKEGELVVASFVILGKAGQNRGENLAMVNVQLTPAENRTIRVQRIIEAWQKAVPAEPGIKRLAIAALRGGPPGRDIDVRLSDTAPTALKAAAGEVAAALSGFPGVSAISDDLPWGKPELVIDLNERGIALGFTRETVGRQLRNAFEGSIARRLTIGEDEITVRVFAAQPEAGAARVRAFLLKTPAGAYVPLSEVASITERQGFSAIQRRDGKTSVSVTADVNYAVTSNEQIIAKLNETLMPSLAQRYGVEYSFSGRNAEQQEAFGDLRIGLVVALFTIYLILCWVFGNWSQPFVVMLIIPFAISGAVFGHWIMGYKLTFLSYIGLLGLTGIVVNNAIVLIDRLNERLRLGEAVDTAVIGASRDRLRAVILTTVTTIGGLSTLLLETSLQAQFLVPMAITICFGLGVTALLVLFLVPATIGIGLDLKRAITWVFRPTARVAPAE